MAVAQMTDDHHVLVTLSSLARYCGFAEVREREGGRERL